jgi:hypothetical protein
MNEPTAHVRIVKTASGGSWCGSPRRRVVVENRTLCGADATSFDGRERDVRGMLRDPQWSARVCAACVQLLGAAK